MKSGMAFVILKFTKIQADKEKELWTDPSILR